MRRDQGVRKLGGLGSQYVPRGSRAAASSRIAPLCVARGPVRHPPIWDQLREGFFREIRRREFRCPPPPCALLVPCAPPGPKEGLALLLSTSVIVPGPMSKEGPVGLSPEGCDVPSPSEFTPAHRPPSLSSRGAAAREGSRGRAQLNGRCFKRVPGPLEWWAVPCVYMRVRLARHWRWIL